MRILLASLLFVAACGDSTKTADAPPAAIDAVAIDAPIADASPVDAATDAATGGATLTVKNYLAWCSVSVNGAAASTAAQQVVTVTPGAIPLVASGATGFKLGPNMWHHVDGTTGNTGVAGNVSGTMSSATVTVGAGGACVWVCCPFTNGTGCPDSLADQCP
ncbi:MAG: hypothetical protein K8W52_34250 [Deltaproteobacteria bacterium]|nr:hypothetical protein [Deltaproteobacteria bacterium]